MGNHSNKKPKKVLEELLQEQTIANAPPLEVPSNIALGSVHRLVARHQLKDRIKILENIIKTHQPLVQAMKITNNAYQQGVMEGIRQVAAAEREKEQVVKPEPTSEPKDAGAAPNAPPEVAPEVAPEVFSDGHEMGTPILDNVVE